MFTQQVGVFDINNYNNLTTEEIRKLVESQKKQLIKEYNEKFYERNKLIKQSKKLVELYKQVKEGKDIKKKLKDKKKSIKKPKTFDEYFQECIKSKKIPPDTPTYFRKALEKAIKEHDKGIEREKSAFENFAVKYTIEGDPNLTPVEYFNKNDQGHL